MIDSSRYFVVRVVDTASGRHAFVGLGFREREAASDFNAALYDHLQYVRRKKTAHEARLQYEEQQRQRAEQAQGERSAARGGRGSAGTGAAV